MVATNARWNERKRLVIRPKGSPAAADGGTPRAVGAPAGAAAPGSSSSTPRAVELKLNPKEYTIEQSNVYAEIGIPGLEAPILQFVRGNSDKLTFDVLIDETDQTPGTPARDARTRADDILQLARVESERHAPPVCVFEWGNNVMEGVIESVRRQFLLFDANGTPIRIQLSLAVKRYRTLTEQIGTMNRRSPDRTKTYVVSQGDTLPLIAYRSYGDEALWRPIADHNGLGDPTRLRAGQILEIPRIEDAR